MISAINDVTAPTHVLGVTIEQSVKAALRTDSTVAKWGLLRVYRKQNEYEQISGHASELNGQGFSKIDSEILTSISRFLLNRGFLTKKQMAIVYRSLPKYWRQVADGLSADELQQALRGIIAWDSPAGRVMDKSSAPITNNRQGV